MVDFSRLNAAVAGTFCNQSAVWQGQTIPVALNVVPLYQEETFRIVGEEVTAGCQAAHVEGLRSGETLAIDGVDYRVMAVYRDSAGWAMLTLEKQ